LTSIRRVPNITYGNSARHDQAQLGRFVAFSPADLAGITAVSCPSLAADEQHYVYGYTRTLSDLFMVENLR
jgi:hypothetical protein